MEQDLKAYFRVLNQARKVHFRHPNLIGVGAGRCGSTFLYGYLKNHPDIFASPVKETNFFGINQKQFAKKNGWEFSDYERLFLGAGDEKYIAEVTPVYLHLPAAARQIQKTLKTVKIIITIRHPVDRLISQFNHHSKQIGATGLNDYLSKGLEVVERGHVAPRRWFQPGTNIAQSLYSEASELYISLFGRDNVLVLVYEDLKRDISLWTDKINTFLQIPEIGVDARSLGRFKNASKPRENIISDENMTQLEKLYRPDIEKMSEISGRDLFSEYFPR